MSRFLKNRFNSFFHESLILLVPSYLEISKPFVSGKYKNYFLLDESWFRVNLRRLFRFLIGIVKRKNNVLFFFEESNFSIFRDLFKNSKNFATDNMQDGFLFLKRFSHSKNIGCVVFIGSFDNYSLSNVRSISIPVVYISPRLNFNGEYSFFSQFDYIHSNILLKKMLENIFFIQNKIIANEKKKTLQTSKIPPRSSIKKRKNIKV